MRKIFCILSVFIFCCLQAEAQWIKPIQIQPAPDSLECAVIKSQGGNPPEWVEFCQSGATLVSNVLTITNTDCSRDTFSLQTFIDNSNTQITSVTQVGNSLCFQVTDIINNSQVTEFCIDNVFFGCDELAACQIIQDIIQDITNIQIDIANINFQNVGDTTLIYTDDDGVDVVVSICGGIANCQIIQDIQGDITQINTEIANIDVSVIGGDTLIFTNPDGTIDTFPIQHPISDAPVFACENDFSDGTPTQSTNGIEEAIVDTYVFAVNLNGTICNFTVRDSAYRINEAFLEDFIENYYNTDLCCPNDSILTIQNANGLDTAKVWRTYECGTPCLAKYDTIYFGDFGMQYSLLGVMAGGSATQIFQNQYGEGSVHIWQTTNCITQAGPSILTPNATFALSLDLDCVADSLASRICCPSDTIIAITQGLDTIALEHRTYGCYPDCEETIFRVSHDTNNFRTDTGVAPNNTDPRSDVADGSLDMSTANDTYWYDENTDQERVVIDTDDVTEEVMTVTGKVDDCTVPNTRFQDNLGDRDLIIYSNSTLEYQAHYVDNRPIDVTGQVMNFINYPVRGAYAEIITGKSGAILIEIPTFGVNTYVNFEVEIYYNNFIYGHLYTKFKVFPRNFSTAKDISVYPIVNSHFFGVEMNISNMFKYVQGIGGQTYVQIGEVTDNWAQLKYPSVAGTEVLQVFVTKLTGRLIRECSGTEITRIEDDTDLTVLATDFITEYPKVQNIKRPINPMIGTTIWNVNLSVFQEWDGTNWNNL